MGLFGFTCVFSVVTLPVISSVLLKSVRNGSSLYLRHEANKKCNKTQSSKTASVVFFFFFLSLNSDNPACRGGVAPPASSETDMLFRDTGGEPYTAGASYLYTRPLARSNSNILIKADDELLGSKRFLSVIAPFSKFEK